MVFRIELAETVSTELISFLPLSAFASVVNAVVSYNRRPP